MRKPTFITQNERREDIVEHKRTLLEMVEYYTQVDRQLQQEQRDARDGDAELEALDRIQACATVIEMLEDLRERLDDLR